MFVGTFIVRIIILPSGFVRSVQHPAFLILWEFCLSLKIVHVSMELNSRVEYFMTISNREKENEN
jgi:hypothetical protein